MIVKVQIALASSAPRRAHEALVYDRKRQHQLVQLVPARMLGLMRGEPKAFFDAHWAGSHWELVGLAAWQEW